MLLANLSFQSFDLQCVEIEPDVMRREAQHLDLVGSVRVTTRLGPDQCETEERASRNHRQSQSRAQRRSRVVEANDLTVRQHGQNCLVVRVDAFGRIDQRSGNTHTVPTCVPPKESGGRALGEPVEGSNEGSA